MTELMIDCNPHAVIRDSLARSLDVITEKEDELGDLDAAAGDGDHGSGMLRGLRAANHAIKDAPIGGEDDGPAGMLLMQAGSGFADAAGGASGALYGMFLMTIGKTLGAGPFDTQAVHAALDAGMAAIMKLGKSNPGDKTMLDALDPFVRSLNAAADQPLADAWAGALSAAEEGAKSTAEMVAAKGRSSKLGDRSLGHVDPGATSMVYVLHAVGDALKK